MIEIKTQIVCSYGTILNFSDLGRSLMNKYSSIADQRKVENAGAPAERVILVFGDERYYIDCNWERIAFVAQGSRSSFRKEDGKTRFFFDLLDRVSGLDDFTEFEEMHVNSFDLVANTADSPSPPGRFSDIFLSQDIPKPDGHLDDVLILLETTDGDFSVKHSFGPFRPDSDLGKHDLLVFKAPDMELWGDLKSANGLLSKSEISYSGVEMGRERFIAADKIRYSLATNLDSYYSG
jgi:hypothetical protein